MSAAGKFETKKLSLISPVYRNAGTLEELTRRVFEITRGRFREVEYIFVNDGSPDNSREILKSLSTQYDNVRVVNLARNFGQHVAMMAGLSYASGDYILFIDADLGEDPADIPRFLELAEQGYEIVVGQKPADRSSFWRTCLTNLYSQLFNFLSDHPVVPHATNMRLYTRRYANYVLQFQEPPFIGGINSWIGLPIGLVQVRWESEFGKSTYTFARLLRHARNGLLAFSLRPLRFALSVGFLITGLAIFAALLVAFRSIVYGDVVPGYTSMFLLIAFLFGLQFTFMGILGEYLGEIFLGVKRRPRFLIYDTFNLAEDNLIQGKAVREVCPTSAGH